MSTPFLRAVKAGLPIQTRDGRAAQFIAYLPDVAYRYRLLVVETCSDGRKIPTCRDENGAAVPGSEHPSDIILAPPRKVKREGWVVVLPEDPAGYHQTSGVYKSEDALRDYYSQEIANGALVAHITWEEEEKP